MIDTEETITPDSKEGTILIPIGGCGEFGRNMTALVTQGRLYLIDAGIMFADNRKLGVASLFNDISPLVEEYGEPVAYIITHGHEDHIGSLPYMLERWPAPVYIPRWAKALVELRLERLGKTSLSGYLRKVNSGDVVGLGDESFEYVRVNHSIPDANALYIKTKTHKILHSGDFKVDLGSTEQLPVDIDRLKQISKDGVDVFICDSTNAGRPGIGNGERTTLEPLKRAFNSCNGRIFVTTFASNLWRIINIIEAAKSLGKTVCIVGAGMINCLAIAAKEGIYAPEKGDIIELKHIKKYKEKELVFLVSGSQAEFRSGLQRITANEHRVLKIKEGDTVVFSSRIIPGNEKDLAFLTSKIRYQGAHIITPSTEPGIHVSGHAHGGEIEIMLDALKPKYFMPVHGTFNQIMDNAENQGIGFETIICENSTGVFLKGKNAYQFETTGLDNLYIDDVGKLLYHETMRERLRIGENGFVLVSGVFDKSKSEFVQGPILKTFGLINDKPGEDEMRMSKQIQKKLGAVLKDKASKTDDTSLNEHVRVLVRRQAVLDFNKKPTVVSQVWFT